MLHSSPSSTSTKSSMHPSSLHIQCLTRQQNVSTKDGKIQQEKKYAQSLIFMSRKASRDSAAPAATDVVSICATLVEYSAQRPVPARSDKEERRHTAEKGRGRGGGRRRGHAGERDGRRKMSCRPAIRRRTACSPPAPSCWPTLEAAPASSPSAPNSRFARRRTRAASGTPPPSGG